MHEPRDQTREVATTGTNAAFIRPLCPVAAPRAPLLSPFAVLPFGNLFAKDDASQTVQHVQEVRQRRNEVCRFWSQRSVLGRIDSEPVHGAHGRLLASGWDHIATRVPFTLVTAESENHVAIVRGNALGVIHV